MPARRLGGCRTAAGEGAAGQPQLERGARQSTVEAAKRQVGLLVGERDQVLSHEFDSAALRNRAVWRTGRDDHLYRHREVGPMLAPAM